MDKATGEGGFPSIFRHKTGGSRYQGVLTKVGSTTFERARRELAELAGRPVKKVTDADVMEYMARGPENTRLYLQDREAADREVKRK